MRTRSEDADASLASLHPTQMGALVTKATLKLQSSENWSVPEWQHLIRTLSDSAFLQERFPELLDGNDGPTRWLNDFNFLTSYAAVRAGERYVVGNWGMYSDGALKLATRLAKDCEFRNEIANEVFGLSGDELISTCRGVMVEALQQSNRRLYIPGTWGLHSRALDELPEPAESSG